MFYFISKGVANAWLESFKADVKKYSVTDVDIKLHNGFVFVDIPSNILFTTGSATLSSKSIEMLGGIARLLEAQPNLNFLIEGHTDNRGDSVQNKLLSLKRANTIATYLISKGIDSNRIKAIGLGGTKPISDNATEEGRIKNRRTSFTITIP